MLGGVLRYEEIFKQQSCNRYDFEFVIVRCSKGNQPSNAEGKIETVVIEVESYGLPADSTRSTNWQEAAQELNKILEDKGDNRRVEVKVNHVSSGYEEYNKKFNVGSQVWEGSRHKDHKPCGYSHDGRRRLYSVAG